MSVSGVVLFRVFSGPHLGAELVLPAGDQLVGSDDSCDIILQDSSVAARHAAFAIAVTEEGASVRITPLDGDVTLEGKPLPSDGADVPERTPFFLGLTCFAWALPDESADAWRQVAARLQERRSTSPEGKAETPPPPDEEDVILLDDPLALSETGASPNANAVGKGCWGKLRSLPPRKLALVFLILLGLCGLTFSYEGRVPDADKRVKEIQRIITENGFATLVVTPQGQGVVIQGVLLNDAERANVLRLAQGVHYPVYLDVTVRGDRVDAVASAFASRGFSLAVQEKTDNPQDGLNVSGYMKDGLVEERAFSAVRDDVPELRDETLWNRLSRSIRHADAVEAALFPRLKAAELAFVQARYLPGRVELAGRFDVDQRRRLDEVLDKVRAELGVPVVFEVVASFEKPRPQAEARREASPAPFASGEDGAAPSGEVSGFQITGVTLKPMRFISLSTGRRVFEGGLMPGGYVLESIGVKELKLRKDGRIIVYRLRGSDE